MKSRDAQSHIYSNSFRRWSRHPCWSSSDGRDFGSLLDVCCAVVWLDKIFRIQRHRLCRVYKIYIFNSRIFDGFRVSTWFPLGSHFVRWQTEWSEIFAANGKLSNLYYESIVCKNVQFTAMHRKLDYNYLCLTTMVFYAFKMLNVYVYGCVKSYTKLQ